MPVFGYVIIAALAGLVVFAAVVQVRTRRAEKLAISRGQEIRSPEASDPSAESREGPLWAQLRDIRWRIGGT